MAALDPQSLFAAANVSCFNCYGNAEGITRLLKLALLQIIANNKAPTMATDAPSLLKGANIAGYDMYGAGRGEAMLIELALLQIIANALNSLPLSWSGFGFSSVAVGL